MTTLNLVKTTLNLVKTTFKTHQDDF